MLEELKPQAERKPMTTPPQEDRQAIVMCIKVLDEFRRVRPDIPASHIYSFLTVALEEGQGVHEYARDVGIPPTTMTRHLLDLGSMTRHRKPGLGLLVQRMDPNDMRKHQTFLSATGRALLHRVVRAVQLGRH